MFSRRFPELYYKLELSVGDVRVDIVMIDTVVLCGNSDDRESGAPLGPARDDVAAEKQWRWIEKTLASSTSVNCRTFYTKTCFYSYLLDF